MADTTQAHLARLSARAGRRGSAAIPPGGRAVSLVGRDHVRTTVGVSKDLAMDQLHAVNRILWAVVALSGVAVMIMAAVRYLI